MWLVLAVLIWEVQWVWNLSSLHAENKLLPFPFPVSPLPVSAPGTRAPPLGWGSRPVRPAGVPLRGARPPGGLPRSPRVPGPRR